MRLNLRYLNQIYTFFTVNSGVARLKPEPAQPNKNSGLTRIKPERN